ncbi:MAG: ATP-binding protein [Gemmatimonadaceae bacterium]|nr:ATP-binding protein [Gemmatimonadaceae bacterium]
MVARDWRLASDVQRIEPVVADIIALCRAAGFSQRHCGLNVPVAVTEAITNAMLRGNACDEALLVDVTVEVSIEQLVVEVCDQGCGFDLAAVQQSPDDEDWFEREDGRGVFLMRSLMDRVENDKRPGTGEHRLRLVLYRT